MLVDNNFWDAGDLGCGELVLELRGRLLASPGRVLRVVALDPGAPEDIPSWCRMTGHELVRQDQATGSYWIRGRGAAADGAGQTAAQSDLMDGIYSPKLFQLAKGLPSPSQLDAPDATASAKSSTCGSTAEVDVTVSMGAIQTYAQRVNACLLGRATAAIVARQIAGTPLSELQGVTAQMRAMLAAQGPAPDGRWADLAVLAPVHELKGRHASVLLVFTALERAIARLPSGH